MTMEIKYSLQSNIMIKSLELLELRKVDFNIENENILKKEILFDKINKFQQSIFLLDKFGEETWNIEPSILSRYWKNIYIQFSKLLPVASNFFLFNDIIKYQAIELNLRKGILPFDISINHFYHLKTCDIRLIRDIIRNISKHTNQNYSLWNYFDIINEVFDDITDLFEDQSTYNCNRIILSIKEFGIAKTYLQYFDFLQRLQKQIIFEFNGLDVIDQKFLYNSCLNQISINKKLLTKSLFNYNSGNNIFSKLLNKMQIYNNRMHTNISKIHSISFE